MPHPATFITHTPTDELGNLIIDKGIHTLNVYIDLKNVLLSLYIQEVVDQIIVNSNTLNNIDSSIFQSMLYHASIWKKWAVEKKIKNIKIYYCHDRGVSNYHQNIYKKYKENRFISQINLAKQGQILKEIIDKNMDLADNVINKIPNVYYFKLKNLEADFLPYYLITRKHPTEIEGVFHVVSSNDKDLLQVCINRDDVAILQKVKSIRRTVTRNNALANYLKLDKATQTDPDKYLKKVKMVEETPLELLPLIMAISGDSGDDVPGISRMGGLTTTKLLQEPIFKEMYKDSSTLYENVMNHNKVFLDIDEEKVNSLSPTWKKVYTENEYIARSFKLISFEALSRWLEKDDLVVKCDYIKYINDIYSKSNEKLITSSSLIKALGTLEDNQLTLDIIHNLFIGDS